MRTKLLFIIALIFFGEISFSQSSIAYDSKTKSITLNSGVEGTVGVLVKFYGSSTSDPIFLETMSCGYNDGLQIFNYSNGSILNYSQKETTINFKFKKTVTTDTQVVYKFSTNGSCFQDESDMIKITVNYKGGSTTTPPTNPTTPNWNYIHANENLNINEGNLAPLIYGIDASEVLGKLYEHYTYSYQWSMQDSNGIFVPIEGATNKDYFPGVILKSTKFRRSVMYYHYGTSDIQLSNLVALVVAPAPELKNNVITLNGSIINGSMPTGGINSYKYSWVLWGGEEPYTFPDTGQNLELTEDIYNYLTWYPNLIIKRTVTSGRQIIGSNQVVVPSIPLPIAPIQNNTISISGYQITGSQPTGGGGDYRYSWFLGSQEDPIWFDETTKDLNLAPYSRAITILQTDSSAKLFRIVRSIKSSNSNTISLYGTSALKKQALKVNTEESTLLAYPNPTTESINFSTNFPTNKEVEIIVYSETLGNEKSVFKGTLTPSQIVNWKIPASYQKGLYFYRILSGGTEVKTGKIIYQ